MIETIAMVHAGAAKQIDRRHLPRTSRALRSALHNLPLKRRAISDPAPPYVRIHAHRTASADPLMRVMHF
ncbi:hypothetical protein [Burkholderia sp. Nafp2/4-1b]|uniref:hypothetical protein n=1 Tax=Burkholderia sp. Nafp2/4-1b TaxID=2116686 RepID=UPI0013CEC9E2|nr:hypothetical protein [Burkholderia sp. Nafp2/4-1b]